MSNENEQPANSWGDEHEMGETFQDAYLKAVNQNRPQPRSGNTPQSMSETPGRRPRPRGVPGSADFYEEIEGEERPSRSRPTRQSREEVEARLRQRARQQLPTREQGESRPRPAAQSRRPQPRVSTRRDEEIGYPSSASGPVRTTRDFAQEAPRMTRDFARETPRTTRAFSTRHTDSSDGGNDQYDEIDIIEDYPPTRKHHPRHRRRRGVFSTLLTGCLGGLITLLVVAGVLIFLVLHNTPLGQTLGNVGKSAFNQSSQQVLTLSSDTQFVVKNQIGNITVNVSPDASTATLNSIKHVQASSQSDADVQFKHIALNVTTITQGADPACLASTCLLINATIPTTNEDGLFGSGNSPSIDLTITLPASFNSPDPTRPGMLAANASAGAITVSGFNGVLNLNGKAGNITVAHALIYAGTCIQTLHGNISVTQQSIFDLATSSKFTPCSNIVSTDPHRPWFNIKSGVGNVDITLTTNLNNLLLDANTNDGKITDDFNLNITSNDGADTFHGPIIPNTNPTAALYVATSTGNITLHKQ